jgi:hypothetical protein
MEFLMSIKTKIAAVALAALAVTGTMASTSTKAEAYPINWGWGVGAGLIGAAVVGSAIAASNDGYYYGYRRCGWTPGSTSTATTWAAFAPAISDLIG